MHGRLLIAVTELFLFHILTREKRPEFCRSFLFRLGLQKRAVMMRYCLSLFNVGQLGYTPGSARSNTRARSPLVTNKKDFQALVPRIDRDKTPDSDVRFDHAPYLKFNDGKVKTDTNRVDNVNKKYGSASASLPSFPKSLFVLQKALQSAFCISE